MRGPFSSAAFAGLVGSWLLLGSDAQAVALPVEWELTVQVGSAAVRISVAGTGVAIVNGSGASAPSRVSDSLTE